MTLDLLLFFVSLGLMAIAVTLRKPAALLAIITIAQWYIGGELLSQVDLQALNDFPQWLVQFGFRLSLPFAGLLLLKRQPRRPDALHFLGIVVWAVVLSGLTLQLLLPALPFRNGYFYNLLQGYQLHLFIGLITLGFMSEIGKGSKPKSRK